MNLDNVKQPEIRCEVVTKPRFRLKRIPIRAVLFCTFALSPLLSAAPLRVLIATDADTFRDEYSAALQNAGVRVTTAIAPDVAKLAQADVVLLHTSKYEALPADAQAALTAFAHRGGGIVAVNAAVAAGEVVWGKAILGGAWNPAESQKFTSRLMLSVRADAHPIVSEVSSFDVEDDTLYDLMLADDIFVLGSAFTPKINNSRRAAEERAKSKDVRALIYDIQPQMWAFEGENHRAAVFLQGAATTLRHASMRAFIFRGLAWTARRENVDELCREEDLKNLRYPVGGPMRAAEAIRQFEMQPGFRASVVAAEPLVTKPIAVQWDARGRLWVAETPEYPNGRRPLTAEPWEEGGVLEPGRYDRPARDRLSILEDTDGDGLMDKKTVFYEGLELVTGFCMHQDGIIAAAQPELVWIRDTDGDGKADKVIPIFGGFTPGDTHFVPNHFINAPDGWIYASAGGRLTVTKPGSKEILARVAPGLFRFKPDGSAIETVASQGGNAFGAEVTSELELFHGQATSGNPVQHVVLPESVLARAANTKARSMSSVNPGRTVARKDLPDRAPLMQIDQVGRYSAACSTMVYEGGAWPNEYDGTVFTTEPILDIIHHERLKPSGPTFVGELVLPDTEWLRSHDYWFSPIDVTFGPDGAMYVLDFYTPVVAHNDTRGPKHSRSGASVRPDREHYFGRIYRIQHESAPKLTHPDLVKADAATLVGAFEHPSRVVRFNALRVLMEKADTLGVQALSALTSMAGGEQFSPARILALWALHRLDKLTSDILAAATRSENPGVRKNAMLIAESGRIALGGTELTATLNDPDARVRLAALRAMVASPLTADGEAALLAVQSTLDDPWSKAAAAAAVSSNPIALLETVLADGNNQSEDLARSLASALAVNNDAEDIVRALQSAAKSPSATLATVLLNELGEHPPASPADNPAALDVLRPLLSAQDRALAAAALPLAVSWDRTGALRDDAVKVSRELLTLARDSQQPAAWRTRAVRSLLAARSCNADILPGVITLISQPQPDAFRRELIVALASTGEESAGRAFTDVFASLPTAPRSAVFDALVSRPQWTTLLFDALEAKKFTSVIFGPSQVARLATHPDAATTMRAKTLFAMLGGGTNPAKDEIIARLLPVVEKSGDATKGKELFTANCATCHQLADEGFELGPNLEGIGYHSAAELLVHIVDPNRMVDDEHRTWNITTKGGTLYSALIASENSSSVRLRLPAGVTVELKTADIAKREKSTISLMPEGLEAVGDEGMRDLIAYIQSVVPRNATPAAKTTSATAPVDGTTIVPEAVPKTLPTNAVK